MLPGLLLVVLAASPEVAKVSTVDADSNIVMSGATKSGYHEAQHPERTTREVPLREYRDAFPKNRVPIPGKPVRLVCVPTGNRIDERKPYMRVYYWPPDPPTPSAGLPLTAEPGAKMGWVAFSQVDPVYFAYNSAEILPPASQLIQLAEWLRSNPGCTVTLIGYADRRGSAAYNKQLSLRRVETVRDRLVHLGVSQDRIILHGRGAIAMKTGKSYEDHWWAARRVEINLGEFVDTPVPVAAPKKSS